MTTLPDTIDRVQRILDNHPNLREVGSADCQAIIAAAGGAFQPCRSNARSGAAWYARKDVESALVKLSAEQVAEAPPTTPALPKETVPADQAFTIPADPPAADDDDDIEDVPEDQEDAAALAAQADRLESLGLEDATVRVLVEQGIQTTSALRRYVESGNKIDALDNVGPKRLAEIESALSPLPATA